LVEFRAGAFELITSPRLLQELDDVLHREKFRRHVADAEVDAYVRLLRRHSTLVDDPEPPKASLSADPDDEYLIALARAARADALVTGDPHLTRLRGLIPVFTPRDFLETLQVR
jgi:putative PIN family toxin of toxin-antitoxin system